MYSKRPSQLVFFEVFEMGDHSKLSVIPKPFEAKNHRDPQRRKSALFERRNVNCAAAQLDQAYRRLQSD